MVEFVWLGGPLDDLLGERQGWFQCRRGALTGVQVQRLDRLLNGVLVRSSDSRTAETARSALELLKLYY